MKMFMVVTALATASSALAGTAEENTAAAIARITARDPAIHAVIPVDPTALDRRVRSTGCAAHGGRCSACRS